MHELKVTAGALRPSGPAGVLRHRGHGRRYRGAAERVQVRQLTLDGVSYGSYVAEQFALAHPAQVSRLVLDSVVPSWNVDPFQLASMRETATVLRAVCAAQGCAFDPAAPCGEHQSLI
jgi:pimeloyl-ACP methyl ester carboxylesterase